MLFKPVVTLGAVLGWATHVKSQFNNPPGVDVWCGKAYRETNASFEPGGWLEKPPTNSGPNPLRLTLDVYRRYSFYVDSEAAEVNGTFVVNTRVSDNDLYGGLYENSTTDPEHYSAKVPFTELVLTVKNENVTLVDHKRVPVNETGVEIDFDLTLLKDLGNTTLFQAVGTSPDELQSYESLVKVEVLPERTDGGSMARLDRRTGGIHVRSQLTDDAWKPLFPVGFYTRWDWISWLVDPEHNPQPENLASNNTKSLAEYKARGYNLVHPVPPGGFESFDTATFEKFLTICDELELYVMYDMRHTYLNLSSISAQLPRLQAHPSLLLYYTGDEPDGWTDPLEGTRDAYNHIQSIDPYHPISLVLNCYNFHFKEYTAGADIILEDAYPIIKSSTFSPVYNTVCNKTYGDCGCDFCHVGDSAYPEYVRHRFQDVVERTKRMYEYQTWLGSRYMKPVWGVPQWFYDADSFWERWATREEAIVMALLRVQYGAKGITGWLFPTGPEVETATTDLAKVLTREDISALLINVPPQALTPYDIHDEPVEGLHATAWLGDGYLLLIIVWDSAEFGKGGYINIPGVVGKMEVLLGEGWGWDEDYPGMIEKETTMPYEFAVLRVELGSEGNVTLGRWV